MKDLHQHSIDSSPPSPPSNICIERRTGESVSGELAARHRLTPLWDQHTMLAWPSDVTVVYIHKMKKKRKVIWLKYLAKRTRDRRGLKTYLEAWACLEIRGNYAWRNGNSCSNFLRNFAIFVYNYCMIIRRQRHRDGVLQQKPLYNHNITIRLTR
jgi:hypothetical protein